MNQASQSNPPRILEGIKIIELGHYFSAPLTGLLLAEQGAEVLHIVDPQAPDPDPVMNAILERGKIRCPLDLRVTENIKILKELLASADIVLENYSPKTMAKLGIDFSEIRATTNPGLISISIPGFFTGDQRSDVPAWEAVIGMAGLLYEKPLKPPIYNTFPVGSILGGLYAADAAVAALIARDRDGVGQHIEVSLYGSDINAQMLQVMVLNNAPRSFMPLKMLGTPFMGVWECSDNQYIYVHLSMPLHTALILDTLEQNGFAEEIHKLRAVISPETLQDPTKVKSISEAKEIQTNFAALYKKLPAAAWEKLLGDKLCVIKVRTLEEWTEESIKSGMTDCARVQDPLFGELTMPGPAIAINRSHPTLFPRKMISEPLTTIVQRWQTTKYTPKKSTSKTTQSTTSDAPLAGVRVLDISRVIAGPYSVRILTELGAEVLSVQPPTNLDWALSFHVGFNVGKKSITLDSATHEGRELFWKLFDTFQPDVFVQNYRSMDFAKEIGLDEQNLLKRKANLVYTHLNAYGIEGSWQNKPAFEQVIQAVTGIQLAYSQGKRPKLVPYAILDFGAGLLGAFGSLLGIYHQRKTGAGGFYHVHMTNMALLLLLPGFSAYQKPASAPQQSTSAIVEANVVKSKDCYMAISGQRASLFLLFEKAGFLTPALTTGFNMEDSNQFIALFQALSPQFRKKTFNEWQQKLTEFGLDNQIGLMARVKVRQILDNVQKNDPHPLKLVCIKDYPGLKPLNFVRTPIRFGLTPLVDVAPAPVRGYHTKEWMAKLGKAAADKEGVFPYPKDKPFLIWLWNFVAWGLFALKTGNM